MYKSTCITKPDPHSTPHHSKSPQRSQLDLSCFSKISSISHRRGNLSPGQHIHETKTSSSNKICSSFTIPSTPHSAPFTHRHGHAPTQMSGHQVPPRASSAAHITRWGPQRSHTAISYEAPGETSPSKSNAPTASPKRSLKGANTSAGMGKCKLE